MRGDGTVADRKNDKRKQIPLTVRPNAFARTERKAERAIREVREDAERRVEDSVERVEHSVERFGEELRETVPPPAIPKANRIIAVLIIASLCISVLQVISQCVLSWGHLTELFTGTVNSYGIVAIVYGFLAALNFAGLIVLIYLDRKGRIFEARMLLRVLVVLLLAGLLTSVALNGVVWLEITYVFQFICAVAYQIYNDPNLDRAPAFKNPFKDGKEARKKVYERDPDRRGYIPLNFFNLFWIFMTASVLGLCMEMVFCLLVNHVWESRAGLLWGPFSPIYGFGALLMTIALNRMWYRNALFIFVVSGVIGAAFEFFVSWYMQTAFGVVAWDYSGTFLSIDGRTDFAHACAWGLCGLVWIRILLPGVMQVVDIIPLKWRATITVIFFTFMVVNAIMTLLALDCWSQREAGLPVENEVQVWFDEHYDDEFMKERFSTMGMSQESALRAQQNL